MRVSSKMIVTASVRHEGSRIRRAHNAVRSMSLVKDNKARTNISLVVLSVIGVIITFCVWIFSPSPILPLKDAGTTLSNSLSNSNIPSVQKISNLPNVVILLFVVLVVFGWIFAAIRSTK